ncbi:MAG: TonB-dependent receptor [Opitutaceae bacterium]|nr:TonB-dependent receptor [Opitutaceae bacterium]
MYKNSDPVMNFAQKIFPVFNSCARLLCFLAALTVISAFAVAQEPARQDPGAITGRITNKATKKYLINVSVTVVDTPIRTVTDQDGNYAVRNLQPGSYSLIFEYTGLDIMRVPVQVEPGKTVTRDIEMTSDVYHLETFVVSSDREGQAQAIQEQKMAVDSRYVLAADSFGNIQDGNVGELLKQLPGVMVFDSSAAVEGEGAPGELTGIKIRGAMGDQSALVTLNGNEASSASSIGAASRSFALKGFNVDNIESLEIFKASTPAHPGNTLGGLVNFTTRSAFQQKGRRLTLDTQLNFIEGYWGFGSRLHSNPERTREFYPGATFSYSEAFFQNTPHPVGISLTLGANRSARYGPRLYAGYAAVQSELPWGQPDLSDVPVPATSYRWQDEDAIYDSVRAALTMDYKVSPYTSAYLVFGWDRQKQSDGGYRRLIANAGAILPGTNMDRMEASEAQGVNINASVGLFRFEQKNFRINPGVKHNWSGLSLNYDIYYSKSTSDRDAKRVDYYLADNSENAASRVKFVVDNILASGGDGANLKIISGADPADLDSWNSLTLGYQPQSVDDKRYGGKIDAKKSLLFRFPLQLQSGAAHNVRESAYERPDYRYDMTGADKLLGTPDDPRLGSYLDRNRTSSEFFYGDRLPEIAWASPDAVWDVFQSNPDMFWGQHANNAQAVMQNSRSFKEEVTAAYFMGTWKLASLTVLAGARWERTDGESHGYIRMAEQGSSSDPSYEPDAAERAFGRWQPRSVSKSYDNWLPSLHLKYEPLKNFILRGSITNDIGRPSVENMIAASAVDHQGRSIRISNPDLIPQAGRNCDLSIEYYIKNGVISLAGFYKDQKNRIENIQYVVGAGMDNGFDGMYENYTVYQNINATHVKIQGFEFSFSQRLHYLPWLFKNLRLVCNYTYNESKRTQLNSPGTWLETKNYGSPRDTANAMIAYSGRRFSWQVKCNWRGNYINEMYYWGQNTNRPTTIPYSFYKWDETLQFDIGASCAFSRVWTLYFDWRNLTSEAAVRRWNYSNVMREYHRGLSNIAIGLRGRF